MKEQTQSNMAPLPESESVRVVIQARPLLPFESAEGARSVLALSSEPPIVSVDSAQRQGAPSVFESFDAVYDAGADARVGTSSSARLYSEHVEPLVRCVFDGVNATAFAYGQTCAGKSYTMDRLIHGVSDAVFARRDAVAEERSATVTVRVGFIEIYNERIRDLVDGTNTPLGAAGINIQVRERRGRGGGVFLDGAKERVVDDAPALQRIIAEGGVLRQTAATGMNSSSSRSHSVITLSVQVEPAAPDGAAGANARAPTPTLSAKLHLVDLAGSERAKRTAAKGDRFREGVQINTSLFALAKVISALADNARARRGAAKKHVPYRDSKLTRLLQDSLGGSARTLLIACVSPASSSREETIGTLRYAARAKAIKNKLKVNVDAHAVEVADLRAALARARAQVSALAAENQALRGGAPVAPPITRRTDAIAVATSEQAMAAHLIVGRDSLVASRGPRRPQSATGGTVGLASVTPHNADVAAARSGPAPRRRARANGGDDSNSASTMRSLRRATVDPDDGNRAPVSRLRRRRLRAETPRSTSLLTEDEEEEGGGGGTAVDGDAAHKPHVQHALHVARTDEMRRSFTARTLRLEREKAALEASKADLQRRLREAQKEHALCGKPRTARTGARARAREHSHTGDMIRLRRERNESVRAHRSAEQKLSEARGVRNDLLRKVAAGMARVDSVRKELGRDNRTLAKNMALLKSQLERSLILRARQDAAVARLQAENDVLKRKFADDVRDAARAPHG